MVHVLKNMSVRLWISAAAGGLATLGLLALLGSPLKLSFNLTATAVLMALAYLGSGWILNRIASLKLQDCLREATSRERTARVGEAADALHKAVVVFDSFMVSPLLRRRMGRELSGRMARFHIARAVKSPEAEAFIASYLWSYPDDAEVAEFWLEHARPGITANQEHLALVDRLAAAQPENTAVLILIAKSYLARRRTDYSALQVYKNLLREPAPFHGPEVEELADLFLQEARSDEWALEVYLKAHIRDSKRVDYLKGLAACLGQIPHSDRNEPLLASSREALSNIDRNTILQWQASFGQLAAPVSRQEETRAQEPGQVLLRVARNTLKSLPKGAGAGFRILLSSFDAAANFWKESRNARHAARWTAVILFAVIVVVSAISTFRYISETRETPEETAPAASKPKPQMATSGRYTLQVASFRDRPKAEAFADRLQKLGYAAYCGESRTSEEDVWYYVRISRFEDKQEARKFADDLKSKGIIDDYYIANFTE
jgi:hypothetical protein